LAQQAGKLFHRPYIPTLEENNARQGLLEHGDFLRLRQELSDYLKDPVSFLYLSGWRKGEMQSLEWRGCGRGRNKASPGDLEKQNSAPPTASRRACGDRRPLARNEKAGLSLCFSFGRRAYWGF